MTFTVIAGPLCVGPEHNCDARAVRALHSRLRARGITGKVALGHAMRKLLHLAFAVWKSGKPFDPQHYPWDQTAKNKEAAGHRRDQRPREKVVTAIPSTTLRDTIRNVNESPLDQTGPCLLASPE